MALGGGAGQQLIGSQPLPTAQPPNPAPGFAELGGGGEKNPKMSPNPPTFTPKMGAWGGGEMEPCPKGTQIHRKRTQIHH